MTERKLIRFPESKETPLTGHPPGGRCMPLRCYCRECPHYVPLARVVDVPDAVLKANNTRQAASWADREEDTWLDKL